MAILDLFFPKTCLECGKEGKYICEICIKKVPLRGWSKSGYSSIFKYEGVIRKAIVALKYKHSTEIAQELARVCIKNIPPHQFTSHTTLIPIPLHWQRHNVRGFNQSERVGKLIAKEMGWGFTPSLLIKKRATTSQVELTVEERHKNLTGVFSLNSKLHLPASVVLFDDVFTTGSTLQEAAKVLKSGGVEKIVGLTIAR